MKHNMEHISMEKATERPWKVGRVHLRLEQDEDSIPLIYTHDGALEVAQVRTSAPDSGEREANAALIVHAVNAHEALIEACEAALMEQIDDMGRKSETHLKLEAALNLAKRA